MGKKVLSLRVDNLFDTHLSTEAERRGFRKSQFVEECCKKIMYGKQCLDVSSEVKSQIELLYQLILYNPSWEDSEVLIKKEVTFLWNLMPKKTPYSKQ